MDYADFLNQHFTEPSSNNKKTINHKVKFEIVLDAKIDMNKIKILKLLCNKYKICFTEGDDI